MLRTLRPSAAEQPAAMPSVVHKLSAALANQIAAGEVVERPSSAVKELVENSLDAGATRIEIAIAGGGLGSIAITDDGFGMTEADAILALERHATSKIREFDDLGRIHSFGFRGEALPSIASVSRFRLTTRQAGQRGGTSIHVDERGVLRAEPVGCAEGTRVEAADLFYNVPARRKFLKSVATETAHVNDVVRSAALARPDVTFVLTRDGKITREYLRAASRHERALALAQGEPLTPVRFARGPLTVEAYLAPPERARAGASHLDVLVNGRPVRDLKLARAVAQAFGTMLDAGRYPFGVVYLDLPAGDVDVNVHPQKSEVRFADSRAVYEALRFALEEQLGGVFRGRAARPAIGSFVVGRGRAEPPRSAHVAPTPTPTVSQADADEPSLFRSVRFYAGLRFVGQVRGTYLLCEGADGLYVLDQHAAAERVTFHTLRARFAARSLSPQRLPIPAPVVLAAEEIAALEAADDELAALGFELRAVRENTVAVHALPALLRTHDPKAMVCELAAELARSGPRAFSERLDLVLATLACHGSLRAGDVVAKEEAEALLAVLDDVDFSLPCPHGRPVLFRLGFDDIERRVQR